MLDVHVTRAGWKPNVDRFVSRPFLPKQGGSIRDFDCRLLLYSMAVMFGLLGVRHRRRSVTDFRKNVSADKR